MLSNQSAFAQFNRFRNELDRVFGTDALSWRRNETYLPVNVWEDQKAFYVEAEIPGMDLDDLNIDIQDGDELSIEGERKKPVIDGGNWHRRERGFGKFNRSFKLSSDVDVTKVDALLKHGVLTITLPKTETVQRKTIQINVAD